MNAKTFRVLLDGMGLEELDSVIEEAQRLARFKAEDALYFHEAPFYRHAATGFGGPFDDAWHLRRKELQDLVDQYRYGFTITTQQVYGMESYIPTWVSVTLIAETLLLVGVIIARFEGLL